MIIKTENDRFNKRKTYERGWGESVFV